MSSAFSHLAAEIYCMEFSTWPAGLTYSSVNGQICCVLCTVSGSFEEFNLLRQFKLLCLLLDFYHGPSLSLWLWLAAGKRKKNFFYLSSLIFLTFLLLRPLLLYFAFPRRYSFTAASKERESFTHWVCGTQETPQKVGVTESWLWICLIFHKGFCAVTFKAEKNNTIKNRESH